jgi:hypothetical protein
MTTNNSNTKTANLYPFVTKAQLKERLTTDHDFACKAMVILFALQTAYEQSTDSTLDRNRQGFMSSHAVHGSRIARAISAGEVISEEDHARVDVIAPRYSRQLAVYFRAEAIASQPALAAAGAVFGV